MDGVGARVVGVSVAISIVALVVVACGPPPSSPKRCYTAPGIEIGGDIVRVLPDIRLRGEWNTIENVALHHPARPDRGEKPCSRARFGTATAVLAVPGTEVAACRSVDPTFNAALVQTYTGIPLFFLCAALPA